MASSLRSGRRRPTLPTILILLAALLAVSSPPSAVVVVRAETAIVPVVNPTMTTTSSYAAAARKLEQEQQQPSFSSEDELSPSSEDPDPIAQHAKQYADDDAAAAKAIGGLPDRYEFWSNAFAYAFLGELARKHPEHCAVHSIGTSTRGHPLWVLTFARRRHADDAFSSSESSSPWASPPDPADGTELPPPTTAGTPSFLYVGNIHGDEPVGRQLMLYLAEELCARGADEKDVEAQAMLDAGALHLLVSMNPDGYEDGVRFNHAGMDLNRDYPDPIRDGTTPSALRPKGTEQPETLAVMRFVSRHHSSLTGMVSLHEGELLVNIPWDGVPSGKMGMRYRAENPTKDDALFRALADAYVASQPELSGNTRLDQIQDGLRGGVRHAVGRTPPGVVQGSVW